MEEQADNRETQPKKPDEERNIIRLGNAIVKCNKCGTEVMTNPVQKYLYELVLRLQKGNTAMFRASPNKLAIAEAIFGLTYRFKIREDFRKTIMIDNKEYVDIYVMVI